MPSASDLERFPGATVTAKVRWTSIVPAETRLLMLAPELNGAFMTCVVMGFQQDVSLVTLRVLNPIAEKMTSGTAFELHREVGLELIATGVTQ